MSLKKYWWLFILAAPGLAGLGLGALIYYKVSVWQYPGPDTIVEILPGEGFARINGKLSKKNIISSAKIFHRYSQLTGQMTSFKSGRFNITKGSNMLDVISTLVSGRSITISTTIPEGKNLFEIAQILYQAGIIKDKKSFIKLAKSSEFSRRLGVPALSLIHISEPTRRS